MAGFGVGMALSGDKDLMRMFDRMPKELYNAVKFASPRAMQIVAEAASRKAEAFKDSGLLAASIGVKMKAYPKSGSVVAIVGPRKGFKGLVKVTRRLGNTVFTYEEYRDPMYYAHLVEFGTQPHDLGEGSSMRKDIIKGGRGVHPGSRPRSFLRSSMDDAKWHVLKAFEDRTAKRFIVNVKRTAAKAKAA